MRRPIGTEIAVSSKNPPRANLDGADGDDREMRACDGLAARRRNAATTGSLRSAARGKPYAGPFLWHNKIRRRRSIKSVPGAMFESFRRREKDSRIHRDGFDACTGFVQGDQMFLVKQGRRAGRRS